MQSKKEDKFKSGQVNGFFAIEQNTKEKVLSRVTSVIFAELKSRSKYWWL